MKKLLATLALLLITQTALAFDHRHAAWDALLKKQVVLISNGHASQVNYAGFQADRTRNRFDAAGNTLSVSKIFDGYQGDFEQGLIPQVGQPGPPHELRRTGRGSGRAVHGHGLSQPV